MTQEKDSKTLQEPADIAISVDVVRNLRRQLDELLAASEPANKRLQEAATELAKMVMARHAMSVGDLSDELAAHATKQAEGAYEMLDAATLDELVKTFLVSQVDALRLRELLAQMERTDEDSAKLVKRADRVRKRLQAASG